MSFRRESKNNNITKINDLYLIFIVPSVFSALRQPQIWNRFMGPPSVVQAKNLSNFLSFSQKGFSYLKQQQNLLVAKHLRNYKSLDKSIEIDLK